MNLQEFINQWNGKKLDYDGTYGNQCVDLTKKWLSGLGYSVTGAWGNGIDWDKNGYRDGLTWIANTPSGIPKEGDIMVFGGGSYGHVDIFISGDINSFKAFDQNYPNGKLEPCGIFTHKYTGNLYVKGWLRPDKYNPAPTVDPKDTRIIELEAQVIDFQAREDDAKRKLEACEKQTNVTIVRMQTDIDNLNSDKKSLEANLEAIRSSLESSKQENNQLEDTNIQLSSKNSTLRKNIAELEKKLLECEKKVVVKSFWQKIIDFLKGVK